jgi:hypothetical protein
MGEPFVDAVTESKRSLKLQSRFAPTIPNHFRLVCDTFMNDD